MRHITSDWLNGAEEFFTVLYSTPRTQVASMVLCPGHPSGEYGSDHPNADQVLVVLDGQVEATINGEKRTMGPGDTVMIVAGEPHEFAAVGGKPARTMNVYGPPAYPEDD